MFQNSVDECVSRNDEKSLMDKKTLHFKTMSDVINNHQGAVFPSSALIFLGRLRKKKKMTKRGVDAHTYMRSLEIENIFGIDLL